LFVDTQLCTVHSTTQPSQEEFKIPQIPFAKFRAACPFIIFYFSLPMSVKCFNFHETLLLLTPLTPVLPIEDFPAVLSEGSLPLDDERLSYEMLIGEKIAVFADHPSPGSVGDLFCWHLVMILSPVL
jgi:hypothetical protein